MQQRSAHENNCQASYQLPKRRRNWPQPRKNRASTGMYNRHLQFDGGIYILVAAIWEDNNNERRETLRR